MIQTLHLRPPLTNSEFRVFFFFLPVIDSVWGPQGSCGNPFQFDSSPPCFYLLLHPSTLLLNLNLVGEIKNSLACCTGLHHRPINTKYFGHVRLGPCDYLGSFNSQIKHGFSCRPQYDRSILLRALKTLVFNVETSLWKADQGCCEGLDGKTMKHNLTLPQLKL